MVAAQFLESGQYLDHDQFQLNKKGVVSRMNVNRKAEKHKDRGEQEACPTQVGGSWKLSSTLIIGELVQSFLESKYPTKL